MGLATLLLQAYPFGTPLEGIVIAIAWGNYWLILFAIKILRGITSPVKWWREKAMA